LLAEGVVAEEDVVPRQVAEQGVWPVEHRRLDEDQLFLSQTEVIPGLDGMEVPVLVVMAHERLDAVGGAIDRLIGDAGHQFGKGATVIDLCMVGNDVVDLLQIDRLFKVLDILLGEGRPDRIDHGDLLLLD